MERFRANIGYVLYCSAIPTVGLRDGTDDRLAAVQQCEDPRNESRSQPDRLSLQLGIECVLHHLHAVRSICGCDPLAFHVLSLYLELKFQATSF